MLRRGMWLGMFVTACGLLLQSGCTEQTPKMTGGTNVAPGMNNKPGVPAPNAANATKPAPETNGKTAATDKGAEAENGAEEEETKPQPPPDAGSTTGAGVDLPGDGQ